MEEKKLKSKPIFMNQYVEVEGNPYANKSETELKYIWLKKNLSLLIPFVKVKLIETADDNSRILGDIWLYDYYGEYLEEDEEG